MRLKTKHQNKYTFVNNLSVQGYEDDVSILIVNNITKTGKKLVISSPNKSKIIAQFDKAMKQAKIESIIAFIITMLIFALLYSIYRHFKRVLNLVKKVDFDNSGKMAVIPEQNVQEFDEITQYINQFGQKYHKFYTELEKDLDYDFITGLYNRRGIVRKVVKDIQNHRFFNACACVILSLSNLRQINESYGYKIGDLFLRESADRLRILYKERDDIYLGRLFGDELIILFHKANQSEIEKEVEKLISCFSEYMYLEDRSIMLKPAIGFIHASQTEFNIDNMLDLASTALGYARREKKSIMQYKLLMTNVRQRRVFLENALKQAISESEISPHYQVLIDAKTNTLYGVEALARWESPRMGVIYPNEFIPIAEENGSIKEIGLQMLEKASKHIGEMMKNGLLNEDFCLHLNVSALQLVDLNFIYRVREVINQSELQAKNYCLEITETSLLELSDSVIKELYELHVLVQTRSDTLT